MEMMVVVVAGCGDVVVASFRFIIAQFGSQGLSLLFFFFFFSASTSPSPPIVHLPGKLFNNNNNKIEAKKEMVG